MKASTSADLPGADAPVPPSQPALWLLRVAALGLFGVKFAADSAAAWFVVFGEWQYFLCTLPFTIPALLVLIWLTRDQRFADEVVDGADGLDALYAMPYGLVLIFAWARGWGSLALLLAYVFLSSTTLWTWWARTRWAKS